MDSFLKKIKKKIFKKWHTGIVFEKFSSNVWAAWFINAITASSMFML